MVVEQRDSLAKIEKKINFLIKAHGNHESEPARSEYAVEN